jgi:transposase
MLTKTEDDWTIVLKIFAAAQSRRGHPPSRAQSPGQNDRKFLEALQFFTVHNLTWRALPAAFGAWNSIWKRFWRLSRTGVIEAFFQLLAEISKTAHLVQMLDTTVVRAHVSAAGAKGGQHNQALGVHAAGFPVKSTSRPTLTGCRSPSLSVPD